MKKVIALFLSLSLLCLAGCAGGGSEEKKVVNVYNWGEYIDESIFEKFEAETGIEVNYQIFETNEQMYSILKGGGADYDVVIPSDYMISRMINEDMLEKINYENIPNMSKIDSAYLNMDYDPENLYTVPYMWGTVGLIYNTTVVKEEITSWSLLFDEQYKGQILMFDNSRDAMGIALMYLGYSANTTDKAELDEAFALLEMQKPLLQGYVMDQIFDKLESGEAAIGPYYAGDYLSMLENNENLAFCLPEEGSNVFVDCMCIPKGAANKENAEKFINYMCETEVCLKNMDVTGYSTPSKEAYEQLSEEVKNDGVSYPSAEVLSRCQSYITLPQETLDLYDSYWVRLKS